MVGYISESAGGNYTPTPEGQHIMVCSRIIDLGTQPGSPQFPTPKRKIRIFWELPDERTSYTDAEGRTHEGPTLHSEQFSVSFHEKSTLRQRLESWRGTPFTNADFAGPPNGFHLRKLIGVPALAQIIHDHRDGKTYANLNAIMSPPKAMREQYKGKIEGDAIFFDLDDFQQAEFDKLSDRLKETIKNSPEYRAIFGMNGAASDTQDDRFGSGYGAGGSALDDGDGIPFMREDRA